MYSITSSIKIKVPLQAVQQNIWNIQFWTFIWNPLQKVRVFYDDGIHQDFELQVEWQGSIENVRTIRFLKDSKNIFFFSPKPPSPTILHHGLWHFTPLLNQVTELVATRWFKLPDFDNYNRKVHKQDFINGFQLRLDNLVDKLRGLCEKQM